MKGRIVVIDNDETTLATVRSILQAEGYEVLSATSGLEANQFIYGAVAPDLILLDVVMPFCDGTKKTEFIKERESSRTIPVVLMSGKTKGELKKLAASSGADGYITKPISRESLLTEVAGHIPVAK